MTIHYRKGTSEDSFAVFNVFLKSIMDYGERMNVQAITGGNDPAKLDSLWGTRKPMFDFLAKHASEFWVAERDGDIVGYARSFDDDGLQELTEFFVLPGQQSAGIGSELLSRAFADSGSPHRTIIATFDERALHRYMKMGLRGRFLLKYFYRKAEKVRVETDLSPERMDLKSHLDSINRIDQALLTHSRPAVHHWLAEVREGFVYKRRDEITGYGYVGSTHGPFAVLDENDFPAILAHAESRTAEKGEEFGASAPLINSKAIEYFIERRYRIDSFSAIVMSNVSFGKFENYLCFTPEFFL